MKSRLKINLAVSLAVICLSTAFISLWGCSIAPATETLTYDDVISLTVPSNYEEEKQSSNGKITTFAISIDDAVAVTIHKVGNTSGIDAATAEAQVDGFDADDVYFTEIEGLNKSDVFTWDTRKSGGEGKTLVFQVGKNSYIMQVLCFDDDPRHQALVDSVIDSVKVG